MFRPIATQALICLLALSASASAKDAAPVLSPEAGKQRFLEDAHDVRRDLKRHDKKYAELAGEDRKQVLAALDRMEQTMTPVSSVSELDDASHAQLREDQQLVNSLLAKAVEDSRRVCRRIKPVGSNMAKLLCETVAERQRRIAEESKEVRQLYDPTQLGEGVIREAGDGGR